MAAIPKMLIPLSHLDVGCERLSRFFLFMGLSKKTTCLLGRMAAWQKLISAEMSTIVYNGGRSRKVKTLKIRPPSCPLIDPLHRPPPLITTISDKKYRSSNLLEIFLIL